MATQKRCIALAAVAAAASAMLVAGPAFAGSVSATAEAYVTVLDPMSVTQVSDLSVAAIIRPARGAVEARISPASYDVVAPPGETFSVESSRVVQMWRDGGVGILEARLEPARHQPAMPGGGPDFAVHRFALGGSLPVSARAETGFYTGAVSVIVNYN